MGSARRGEDKSHHLPCLHTPHPISRSPVVCTAASSLLLFYPRAALGVLHPRLNSTMQVEWCSWVGFLCTWPWPLARLLPVNPSRHGLPACHVLGPRRNTLLPSEAQGLSKDKKEKSIYNNVWDAWIALLASQCPFILRYSPLFYWACVPQMWIVKALPSCLATMLGWAIGTWLKSG